MTKFLLSLHVLAAIIAVGPVAVAASMFPRSLRRAHEDSGAVTGLHLLHRVCRVYAGVGIAVPVFGFATASNMHNPAIPTITIFCTATGCFGARYKEYPATSNISSIGT